MDKKEQARLEAAGFDVFDDACDALGLSNGEKAIVDCRRREFDEVTLKRLEAAGWSHGDYAEFLGMTPEEKAIVERRILATKKSSAPARRTGGSRETHLMQPVPSLDRMTRADLDRELSAGEKARIEGHVTPLAVVLAQVRQEMR